jgi:hypothetical protein
VWTDTTVAGTQATANFDCSGWTTNAGFGNFGREGRTDQLDADWTNTALVDSSDCATLQRLYCFEQ